MKKKIFLTGCVLEADRKKFEVKNIEIIEQGNIEELLKQILGLSKGIAKTDISDNYKLTAESCNYVPIMVGCNNFCAYCAVPYTRGREKSRSFDEIIKDVKKLISSSRKEIILLGQNVNSYSMGERERRKGAKTDFTVLLETLNDLPGDFVISFTSNHPKDMSDDIINAVATLPKIKKEIHLPVQSGSNEILKAMNRPYAIEKYISIIEKIHNANPEIDITTDVIVGFPGETEKDFEKTVQLFKKIKFHQAYINKYSPRKGTKAYDLGDPVPLEEKHRRWNVLNDIAYHKKYN